MGYEDFYDAQGCLRVDRPALVPTLTLTLTLTLEESNKTHALRRDYLYDFLSHLTNPHPRSSTCCPNRTFDLKHSTLCFGEKDYYLLF